MKRAGKTWIALMLSLVMTAGGISGMTGGVVWGSEIETAQTAETDGNASGSGESSDADSGSDMASEAGSSLGESSDAVSGSDGTGGAVTGSAETTATAGSPENDGKNNLQMTNDGQKAADEQTATVPPATQKAGLEEKGSWYYGNGWEYQYSGAANSSVSMENSMVKATVDYSGDADKDYSKMAISSWHDEGVTFENTVKVRMDFYYDEAKMTSGSFKLAVNSDQLNTGETALDLTKAENVSGTLKKLAVTLEAAAPVTGSVNGITFCLIGVNTDYKGDLWLDDIQFEAGTAQDPDASGKIWDFEDNTTQGWAFDNSWAGDYKGPVSDVCSVENGRLKVIMDYSGNKDSGWIQPAISLSAEGGLDFSGQTTLGFEMYYDPAAMTTGNITVKAVAGNVFNEQMSGINDMTTEDADNGLKKAVFNFEIDAAAAKNEKPEKLMMLLVGNNTDYKGPLYFDNIRLFTPEVVDEYVDATETAKTQTNVSGGNTALSVNGESIGYASQIKLADPSADASAVALYQYLKAVGESGAALYGHMEDTVLKAGSSEFSYSDTEDLTGSLAAINGLDCGGLFSGFASKYNSRYGGSIPETTQGNIQAAALLSNKAIERGAIMTLSCHMPNFAFAAEKDMTAANTYDRYDYSVADSYNLKGNCMNQILPGGAYNARFTAFLDLVAEYAKQVNGAVLFRPFHENTGSWFWWGKAFCDAETYKSVFKYTVEYLRDEKGVHNLLYVYGPGSEAANMAEYGERYPGDEFVDMVGFDTYDGEASSDPDYAFMKNFESVVSVTDQFAKAHNKLFAVTETGITNSAMKKTGNERPEWFTEILDIITKPDYNCAYYMVWSNYDSKNNYYSPFAVSKDENGILHGHELMDGFIRFYNNKKSIFAADQCSAVYGTKPDAPSVSGWDMTGYITAPLAGSRILDETTVTAQLSKADADVSLTVSNGSKEIKLDTSVSGKKAEAKLTKEVLAQLGEAADGKIILYSGDTKLAEITVIMNIAEKEPDPYMVDDFESYYGVDSMLTGTWATNKATGSTVDITLTNSEGESQDGYAMKFAYTEGKDGWGGATITKEVDWSDCNALQFWTIPDGKKQKVVVQIEANTCYEVYLNEYDEYNARAGKPTLVTIPFSEFGQRDTAGHPKGGLAGDADSVSSFGLWVNAIPNEAFENDIVSGVLYYDNLTAVKSDAVKPVFSDPVSVPEHVHNYKYTDNGDGTHTKSCVDGDDTVTEKHNFENGLCVCGVKEQGTPDTSDTPDTPDTKPSDTPDTKPSDTPDTKPSDTPDTKPSDTPDTKPSDTSDTSDTKPSDTKPSDKKPTDSAKPGSSGKPDTPSNNNGTGGVKTGDQAPVAAVAMAGIASMGIIVVTLINRARKKKKI